MLFFSFFPFFLLFFLLTLDFPVKQERKGYTDGDDRADENDGGEIFCDDCMKNLACHKEFKSHRVSFSKHKLRCSVILQIQHQALKEIDDDDNNADH